MQENKDKVAIVTGAAKNIGRATSECLSKLGFNILVHANSDKYGAMETLNIKNSKLRDELLSLYLKLEAYPEIKSALENIKNKGLKTAILSNGNNKMLESAVINANIKTLIDEILSVDECKVYKPASIVYDLVEKKMGVNKQNVLFFSSNAWDMHAASNYGFKTIWVNRFDSTLEKLPGKPERIINSLEQIEKIFKN